MKSSFFALAASALVGFAAAYTAPVGENPQGNPISNPGLNQQVPVAAPFTITWSPTSTGTVTLLLLRGPSNNVVPLYPIVEKIPNTGSFTWVPASDLQNDVTGYGIQLIDDATGFYQYTTQFGISNPGPAVPSSSSTAVIPTTSSIVVPTTSAVVVVPTTSSAVIVPTTSAVVVPTSSVSSIPVLTTQTLSLPASLPAAGSTSYSTKMVTIISCGTAVTNCPGVTHITSAASVTPAPAVATSAPVLAPPSISWSNSTLVASSSTKSGTAASTGFGTTTSTSSPLATFPGSNAGEKIRVGCAMVAVLVAGFALAM